MSIEQSVTLGNILIAALWLSLFADVLLRFAWNKRYFTLGLPIFIKHIPVASQYSSIPPQGVLEEKLRSSLAAHLVFRKIDSYSYGFREKLWTPPALRYIPSMRGLVIFDSRKRQVTIKGLANWSTLWLLLYVLLSSLNLLKTPATDFVCPNIFIMVVFIATYIIQSSAFSMVGKAAAELYTQEGTLNNGGV